MAYTLEWSNAAIKDLEALPRSDQTRIVSAVTELAGNPREASNVTALRGGERLFRKRVGDYRIVFAIEDGRLAVFIVRVRNRREVYR